ncbi:hypothetical protein [Aureispira anguillae]|uniref:Uncharacterized protein n=1 Tax=Aureispira anguillae TaxID=2864201 RepID=A0A915YE12_9BACT|nr:hypothetical protein [Aureispira anguillae]BDS11281.1 hypothetical protein AsAng_0019930 [Aureispira anguillae]
MNKTNHLIKGKRFEKLWETYKDKYTTDGYALIEIKDIYLPFWKCKQAIVVEKEVELDRFSRIILELITKGIDTHHEICAFLGLEPNSFATMQFHFLLKNNLIRETIEAIYELTDIGVAFLAKEMNVKNMETIDFDYFLMDKMGKRNEPFTFFDAQKPIDHLEWSAEKVKTFSGYHIRPTNRLIQDKRSLMLPTEKALEPTFLQISQERNAFAAFFNQQVKQQYFYDFANSTLKKYRQSIAFIALVYEKEDNPREIRLDIRQSKRSVLNFKTHELEKELSQRVSRIWHQLP